MDKPTLTPVWATAVYHGKPTDLAMPVYHKKEVDALLVFKKHVHKAADEQYEE